MKSGRKKEPQATRRQLLEVLGDIILEKGVEGVTLDAVAAAAGVSKGGLLYHFPSKRALMEGFVKDYTQEYLDSGAKIAAEDPERIGRTTRACLRVVADNLYDHKSACLWVTLLATLQDEGKFKANVRDHFYSTMASDSVDRSINVTLAIAYLAVDGLALADLAGVFADDKELRAKIVLALETVTRNPKALSVAKSW